MELLLLVVIGGAVLAGIAWLLVPTISPTPATLGVTDGRFAACPPASENCVSSQFSTRASAQMPPLSFEGMALSDAHSQLVSLLQGMERVTLVTVEPDYIHAEFRSAFWRFVDDTEFYFDEQAQVIHYKSAARLGRGDLGVNRNRMNEISRLWQAQTSAARQASGSVS